ncbi:kinase-like domain-containing protein [Dactylonectria macrodidyma]|uniref:Kinase-like domain-containing protein n=1 Tax=Dactylonectria macrodidyma TaxID=307937 RepID=A0A9P9ES99_9HYPO|nr:kinase-like domain-containing protein [Dactylonectria macrodidyma]
MSSIAGSTAGSQHTLDDEALGKYLLQTSKIPNLQGPIVTTKIGYGQSNPTYYIDDAAGSRFILRKKPPGESISPVAHQIHREFRVLQALSSVEGFPVPKVFDFCKDPSVIGSSFYAIVMEFVKGRILTDPNLSELSPTDRRKARFSAIETLAWLHSLDPDAIGLEGYGKKSDFYRRHCRTWSRVESQQASVKDAATGKALGRAHDKYDVLMDYVRDNSPGERYAIILHPTEPRVIAILDWELSTIGHPLMDLVFHVSPFFEDYVTFEIQAPSPNESSPSKEENQKPSARLELDELLDRYTQLVGFDLRKDGGGKDWQIATIFQYVRAGTVNHGIQARTISGQASSTSSHLYFVKTKKFLDAAFQRVQRIKERRGGLSRI